MLKNHLIYTSHLGVYGIISNNCKILLIKKNRGPYKGLLDLPGGSLKFNESLEEALEREIKEETGCNITSFEQKRSFTTFFNYKENNNFYCLRHIAIIYKITIKGEVKYYGDGKDSDGCIQIDMKSIINAKVSPLVTEAVNLII